MGAERLAVNANSQRLEAQSLQRATPRVLVMASAYLFKMSQPIAIHMLNPWQDVVLRS